MSQPPWRETHLSEKHALPQQHSHYRNGEEYNRETQRDRERETELQRRRETGGRETHRETHLMRSRRRETGQNYKRCRERKRV